MRPRSALLFYCFNSPMFASELLMLNAFSDEWPDSSRTFLYTISRNTNHLPASYPKLSANRLYTSARTTVNLTPSTSLAALFRSPAAPQKQNRSNEPRKLLKTLNLRRKSASECPNMPRFAASCPRKQACLRLSPSQDSQSVSRKPSGAERTCDRSNFRFPRSLQGETKAMSCGPKN